MVTKISTERKITWRDRQRKINGYTPNELFDLIKSILFSNGFHLSNIDNTYRILDTRIFYRSKINIKVTGDCVVKVNIINAYSISPYERFWKVLEFYIGDHV